MSAIAGDLSKSQVDKLGARLRAGTVSDEDLRTLDAFRRSFAQPYAHVVEVVRSQLGFEVTGRPAKSTKSIIDKLQRETIRLAQIQDIAGCRLVVDTVAEQDSVVGTIAKSFGSGATVVDRRLRPSFGYRAVHVIVHSSGKPIEVQVRTALQHLWAELTEKVSDIVDPGIKYGQSSHDIAKVLAEGSVAFAKFEEGEAVFLRATADSGLDSPLSIPQYNEFLKRKKLILDDMEKLVRDITERGLRTK